MTGTARKKVNSAAQVLETPIRRAPMMVAPDREVPGKMAAMTWKRPMIRAVFQVKSRMRVMVGSIFFS